MSEQQSDIPQQEEEEWLAPSLFSDEILIEQEQLEAKKRKEEEEEFRAYIERQRQQQEAARLAEEQANYIPLHRHILVYFLIALKLIITIFLFPLFCLLFISGFSKHPFLGYIIFRDYTRNH